jgi:outer membrane protein
VKAATRQTRGWLLALALALSPALSLAQAPSPRIGYVDMKRLLDQAPQVQQARERLQREFAARDASLAADESRLATLREKLDKDRASLSTDAVAARQRDIDVLAGSVRRARERMQEELKTRSAQELDRSWSTISNAAVEYARSHGYDLVLPSPVIYAGPRVDITDAVLQELRKQRAGASAQ